MKTPRKCSVCRFDDGKKINSHGHGLVKCYLDGKWRTESEKECCTFLPKEEKPKLSHWQCKFCGVLLMTDQSVINPGMCPTCRGIDSFRLISNKEQNKLAVNG